MWRVSMLTMVRLVASRDDDTLKKAFDIVTGLFGHIGLRINTSKTKIVIFTVGRIRAPLSQDVYEAQMPDLYT